MCHITSKQSWYLLKYKEIEMKMLLWLLFPHVGALFNCSPLRNVKMEENKNKRRPLTPTGLLFFLFFLSPFFASQSCLNPREDVSQTRLIKKPLRNKYSHKHCQRFHRQEMQLYEWTQLCRNSTDFCLMNE